MCIYIYIYIYRGEPSQRIQRPHFELILVDGSFRVLECGSTLKGALCAEVIPL